MALTETKFRLSRIVLSAAVFISLCVSTTAEDRVCYWCGPLADQVHRSRQAPPCVGDGEVTLCDPDFPYCAVVATAPPFTVSKYCVKMYQDECYLLYCNSSKTWRMTCPCRGDLCNGPITEREDEAFNTLPKLVARMQNTRTKRTLISTSGFISMNTNRKNQIDNTTIENIKNIRNDTTDTTEEIDTNNNEIQNNVTKAADMGDKMIESLMTDTTASTITVKGDENQTNNINNSSSIADEQVTDNKINYTNMQIVIPTENAESNDLKTEIILMSSEATKLVNDNKHNDATTSNNVNISDNNNENISDTLKTTPEMIKQTVIEVKPIKDTTDASKPIPKNKDNNGNGVKLSEQLPTAEALQHNDTPITKTTEQLTTSTTVINIQHTEGTTEATKPRNNTAVRIDTHILTLVVSIILQY